MGSYIDGNHISNSRASDMSTIRLLSVLNVILLLLPSCKDKPLPPPESKLLDPNGSFTLYVSNQSFAISQVDIQVEIDGEVVVREYFDVADQHNWKAFKLSLSAGQHLLKASSVKGNADLSREFYVTDEHWAVVGYWYYPKSHYNPTPKKFTFNIQDTPILFQ